MNLYEKVEIGTKGFAIVDDEIISFTVDFVGKDVLLMESEDGYISCKKEDFEKDVEILKLKQKGNQMIVVCRECSKDYAKCIAYKIDAKVTNDLLFNLKIRSRYNPELRYFVILNKNLTDSILDELVEDPDVLIEDNIICEV